MIIFDAFSERERKEEKNLIPNSYRWWIKSKQPNKSKAKSHSQKKSAETVNWGEKKNCIYEYEEGAHLATTLLYTLS